MIKFHQKALSVLSVALMSLTSLNAVADAPYPNQPIKIVVPYTSGTGMDIVSRVIAPRLSERVGQPVVVQNLPGASGNIGTELVAKAAPDGYTILMGPNTMTMASQMYKNVAYDPAKDFAPVILSAYGSFMLVASNKSGITSVEDLVKRAKAKPGSINFGSPGVGTPHHLAMELFKLESNTFMLHVPYRGTSGYTQDLISGQIDIGFLPVHAGRSMVKSGRLTALAVGSQKRHPIAPDVPTFDEAGIKRVDVDLWYAFFVPSKTPQSVVMFLNKEIATILQQSEVKEILSKAGMDVVTSTPAELSSIVVKDYARWGNVIRTKQISAE